ncbi:unnamed protein product [Prorocentrum cordatum]|uniref:Uncharacterized protein n=1 Tax=Prorocentrum cordatum TaxID=2364126 RepID=A0ABN9VAA3_9DINO|nr:unnamed protein product [Polarella glacialis]
MSSPSSSSLFMFPLLQQPLLRAPAGAEPGGAQTNNANLETQGSWGIGGSESSAECGHTGVSKVSSSRVLSRPSIQRASARSSEDQEVMILTRSKNSRVC